MALGNDHQPTRPNVEPLTCSDFSVKQPERCTRTSVRYPRPSLLMSCPPDTDSVLQGTAEYRCERCVATGFRKARPPQFHPRFHELGHGDYSSIGPHFVTRLRTLG